MRVALIGGGMRAREAVIPALNGIAQIELAVLCDVWDENIPKALAVADNEPEVVSDYKSLLTRADIDGIILVTPNYLHAQMAEVILESGKPLYLEKPMGINLADCRAIEAAAARTGTPMMIGMQLRYADIYTKMKAELDGGRIGKLRSMHYTQFRTPLRGGWENWRMDANRSGGSILEVTVHHMDLFNWFADCESAKVSAFAGNETIYSDLSMWDEAVVILEYENTVRADIEFSLFAPLTIERNGLCLIGDKGALIQQGNKLTYAGFAPGNEREEIPTQGLAGCDALAFRAFEKLVTENQKPLTTPQAGKLAVAAGLAAEKSISLGRFVTYGEIMDNS